MPSETQRVKLGDLVRVKHGFAFKGEYFVDEPTSHVLVTPGNFAIGGGFQDVKLKFYRGPIPGDYVLKPGDLVVTMTDLSRAADTLGFSAVVPRHPSRVYLHNQRIGLVEVLQPEKVAKAWLHYLMRTAEYRAWVVGSASGSTVKHTSPSRICDFEFDLPALHRQEEAAALLDALEGRIDLLRQTNATLESIAQALFKSWFIDFDPVRAKAEGREPDGMDAATAALFPSEFEESALGAIPKGWVHRPVDALFDVGIGKTPPRKEPHWFSSDTGDVRWVSIRDMGDEGSIVSRTAEFLTNEAIAKFNVRRVPSHTVLMSFKLTVGRLAISDGEMVTNEAIAHFKARLESPSYAYLFCFLKSFDMRSLGSTSSIAEATNSRAVKSIPVLDPGACASAFERLALPLFERMFAIKRQWRVLDELRDMLLPRLISGKLRLPEAEAQIEEAMA